MILNRVYYLTNDWLLDVLYNYEFLRSVPNWAPPWLVDLADYLFWRNLSAIVALVTIVLLSLLYNRYDKPLYPYTIISIRNKEFHPYLSAVIQIIMVVAAVIAILKFLI